MECVRNDFGSPTFWGRYLSDVQGASTGLTKNEIQFLRKRGIKILPIYNAFRDAIDYRQGRIAANNAIFHAKRLGIPKNTVIFANVERFFKVDEAWLRGWVDALYPTGYRPGFYYDPLEGGFNVAYCEAVKHDEKMAQQAILWSAKPELGVSKKQKAPRSFKPKKPNCKANVWVWQYGRDSQTCPIDTNIADKRILGFLH